MLKLEEELKTQMGLFYKDFSHWLKTGEGDFSEDYGICDNLTDWVMVRKFPLWTFRNFLSKSFHDAGLHHVFPFNEGDRFNYCAERDKHNSMYKNPLRVQWIHDHAK